jgi:hypothetical protein
VNAICVVMEAVLGVSIEYLLIEGKKVKGNWEE